MAITAKVRNKQIDTGKVLHALVQGENASGNITFQIIGEEELVEDFNSTYFYLLYTRPSDTRPNVLLLTNKQLQDDVISVTFKPTSYFTAQDGTVQIQIMATDTEGLSIDSETGTISGSVIWQTFPGAMFVHASQLTGTETIIEENVLTQYLAGMQNLNTQTEQAATEAQQAATDADDSAEAAAGSATAAQNAKTDAVAARDKAQEWATKSDGKVDNIDYSSKHYASEAKASEQKASEWAEKDTPVETGKYSAKHWAEQAHAEFDALDTYVDETLKPDLDDYEETKEGELDTYTATKKAELDTYEDSKETELDTYTGTKKTELDTYTGAKKSELDSYVANTNKPALDSYTNNTLKPALLAYEQTQEGALNTYTGTKKTELDSYVTNTSKPSIDDYIDDEKKPEIDAYVEEVEGQLAEDVNVLKSQVNVVSSEVENINAILEGEADVTNTDPAQGESLLAQSRLIHHANLLPNGSFGRVGARSIAWNQLVRNGNFVDKSSWSSTGNVTSWSVADNIATINAQAQTDNTFLDQYNLDFVAGKKYLISFEVFNIDGTSAYAFCGSYPETIYAASSNIATGSWYKHCVRVTASQTGTSRIRIGMRSSAPSGAWSYKIKNVMFFDLTAMNMESLTADQFRSLFPASYYPTDTGHIYDLNPSGFRIRGKNLWDEEWEGGSYSSTGQKVTTQGGRIRSVNKIPALPNTSYYALKGVYILCQYDENEDFISFTQLGIDSSSNVGHSFTTEANTHYLAFATYANYGTTYNNDIQICFDSLPSSVKTTYHPYVGHTVDTPQISDGHYVNENCYDYVENVTEDGVIKGKKHKVGGSYTFTGQEEWKFYPAPDNRFYVTIFANQIKKIAISEVSNILLPSFVPKSASVQYNQHPDYSVASDTTGSVLIYVASWVGKTTAEVASLMVGRKIYFELAEEVITDVEPLRSFGVSDYCTIEPITPQTELPNRADVPFVVETKSNNGIIEQITTNKNNIEAEVATREAQVVKLQKQIDNLTQGAGGYPEITYPDATYGTGEVPPNKAKNAQVVNLIMNSRVKNQLVKNGNFANGTTNWTAEFSSLSVSDGVASITKTLANPSYIRPSDHYNFIAGHVYLGVAWLKGEYTFIGIHNNVTYSAFALSRETPTDSEFSMCSFIYQFGVNDDPATSELAIRNGSAGSAGKTFYAKNIILTDLTLYFGGTVPSDASTIAQIQTNYPELLIPSDYDTGTRVDTTYSSLKSWARNLWDEEWEVGAWNLTTGEKANSSTNIRCKNKISVKPLTTYFFMASKIYYALFYDANDNFIGKLGANGWQNGNTTFETPANCAYVAFYMYDTYGTTYGHDICINKSDSQNGTYTPWHAPKTLTLPTPVTGKSAGSVHQIYYPETGEMTEPLGEHTFTADEGWAAYYAPGGTYRLSFPSMKGSSVNATILGYTFYDNYPSWGNASDKALYMSADSFLYVKNVACTSLDLIKAEMAGKTIIYELATPNPNSQATDPVIVDMIETEGGGRIEAVQTQETKIDSSFTIGYMNI